MTFRTRLFDIPSVEEDQIPGAHHKTTEQSVGLKDDISLVRWSYNCSSKSCNYTGTADKFCDKVHLEALEFPYVTGNYGVTRELGLFLLSQMTSSSKITQVLKAVDTLRYQKYLAKRSDYALKKFLAKRNNPNFSDIYIKEGYNIKMPLSYSFVRDFSTTKQLSSPQVSKTFSAFINAEETPFANSIDSTFNVRKKTFARWGGGREETT